MPISPIVSTIVSGIVSAIVGSPSDAPGYSYDAAASAASTMPVTAGWRIFPPGVMPGKMAGLTSMGDVLINNQVLHAAPGLQIRNEQNRIIQSSMLQGSYFPVLYQLDTTRENVWRIWILSPEEISALNLRGFYFARTLPAMVSPPLQGPD